ncbi:hypothetical protein HDV64DRAFT_106618 [Trichoderma sp. TUCIM 5745]
MWVCTKYPSTCGELLPISLFSSFLLPSLTTRCRYKVHQNFRRSTSPDVNFFPVLLSLSLNPIILPLQCSHNTPLLIAIAASSALATQPLTPLRAKLPTPPIALSHNCRPLSITHMLRRLPGPPMEPSCLAAKRLLVSTRDAPMSEHITLQWLGCKESSATKQHATSNRSSSLVQPSHPTAGGLKAN